VIRNAGFFPGSDHQEGRRFGAALFIWPRSLRWRAVHRISRGVDNGTMWQLQALGGDLCALWRESVAVVWLRSSKLAAGGPAAIGETALMIGEKLAAQQDIAARLITGRLGRTPLAVTAGFTRYMLDGVRANRRRLSRKSDSGQTGQGKA
jgi:hypothetical protein